MPSFLGFLVYLFFIFETKILGPKKGIICLCLALRDEKDLSPEPTGYINGNVEKLKDVIMK